jgi:hypothetical protein
MNRQATILIYSQPGPTYRHEAWKVALRLAEEAEKLLYPLERQMTRQQVWMDILNPRWPLEELAIILACHPASTLGYGDDTVVIVMDSANVTEEVAQRYELFPENTIFRELVLELDPHDHYVCPVCGWDPPLYSGDEDAPVVFSEHHDIHTDCGDGIEWVETWTCQECGEVFDFISASI